MHSGQPRNEYRDEQGQQHGKQPEAALEEYARQRVALCLSLMGTLIASFDDFAGNDRIKVVIIRGNGPAFCAGHDLKEMRCDPAQPAQAKTFQTCAGMMMAIVNLPQPVIAQVHGVATAAGFQLVAACDLAVAADTGRSATPGVNIGLFCSTPGVALSRNVGRKQAKESMRYWRSACPGGPALESEIPIRDGPGLRCSLTQCGLFTAAHAQNSCQPVGPPYSQIQYWPT